MKTIYNARECNPMPTFKEKIGRAYAFSLIKV